MYCLPRWDFPETYLLPLMRARSTALGINVSGASNSPLVVRRKELEKTVGFCFYGVFTLCLHVVSSVVMGCGVPRCGLGSREKSA